MKARLVVFPIKGRTWCFSRSIDPSVSQSANARPSPKLKDIWRNISSNGKPMTENAEIVVDFISEKMNRAWIGLGKAPEGTFKNKIYSLNPHHVRRRLRHIAMRGTIIHKRYLYGSVSVLPFTAAFAVLPLPNIPFFWILFRTYSHWRALQGSERLLVLVSNCSRTSSATLVEGKGDQKDQKETSNGDSELELRDSPYCPWALKPSEELEKLLNAVDDEEGLSKCTISKICQVYRLDAKEVLKYRSW